MDLQQWQNKIKHRTASLLRLGPASACLVACVGTCLDTSRCEDVAVAPTGKELLRACQIQCHVSSEPNTAALAPVPSFLQSLTLSYILIHPPSAIRQPSRI